MATINDIGVPGQPLNSPPLTAWQAAVRDAITGVGGILQVSLSVPSNAAGNSQLTGGTSTVWGGVTVANNGLVVPTAGLYAVTLHGSYASAAGGTIRALWVWDAGASAPPTGNPAVIGQASAALANTGGVGAPLAAAGVYQLAAGTGLRAMARQDSGAALTCSAALAVRLVH